MTRRTFDIISRYISNANRSRIIFDAEGDSAYADMETGEIHLPDKIGHRNVFAVLALLMHESAHIAYSKQALKECVQYKDPPDPTEMHIFNVIEDVRIDGKNFRKLPNVKSFYDRLLKDFCNYSKAGFCSGKKMKQMPPLPQRALISALMSNEGFGKYAFKDPEVNKFLKDNPIEQEIWHACCHIDNKRWQDARDCIQAIKAMLNLPKQPQGQGGLSGDIVAGKCQGKEAQGGEDKTASPLDGMEKLLRPGSMFSESGESLQGKGSGMGEAALQEQTIQQFKELLNVKETKVVEDGSVLDTDNLPAFLTSDIDELFKEDKYIKCKKSKILFLLDGSGSMGEPMLDKNSRVKVVADCIESLTRVLREVQMEESIDVDYEVAKFESSGMDMLSKENWRSNYGAGGGTQLSTAFRQALAYLQKDHTVEGKKIVIVITDGQVGMNQIEDFQRYTVEFGGEVSALVIGVGCDPAGPMALNVLGDNLILSAEHADEIIFEAIRKLL